MMNDLMYKDLGYKLVGLAFEVFNKIGSELKEKIYGNAFEELLKRENLKYNREIYYPLKINDKLVGKNYFDF